MIYFSVYYPPGLFLVCVVLVLGLIECGVFIVSLPCVNVSIWCVYLVCVCVNVLVCLCGVCEC